MIKRISHRIFASLGVHLRLSILLLLFVVPILAQTANSEWRYYGGDEGGSRFSPLAQINTSNVQSLKRAWTYHTGELDLGLATASFQASFSCTPLVVDGVMYLSTPSSRVIALDAETGRELWKFDPQGNKSQREFNSHRGVAYWEDKKTSERRILFGTVDGRLIELDADTGKPVSQFGVDGVVDLRAGGADKFQQDPSWGARVTSPPVVFKDLVIVGWGLPEFPGKGPSGDVRAFSVRTGKLVWTFHTVPHPGEFGSDTWSTGAWKDRMGANVWSTMSVDEARGIVYLPVGSPAYDFYGGDRKGKNLFGNSLVALNAATGKLKWYFQLVHHDLWDYDLPAQPSLITVRREGRSVPAVAVVTKMGFVFVFDRVTGKPLFPIEERPVPQSNVPGEETWPTQPYPVKPPAIARQTMTRDEVSKVSAESQKYCTELFDRLVNKGMYTPAGLEPTLMFPGYHGGGNWSSASFDPASGYLFVNMNEDGAIGQMNAQPEGSPIPYVRRGRFEEYAWFRDQNSRPCQQPPWGTLTAVDLQKGQIAWRVPLGIVEELEAKGIHNTGTQNLGGSIVTAGGLVFIAGTTDRRFRAFDAKTGKQLWEAQLEANGHATPMTFQGKNTGKQFVVVASGGGGFLRSLSKVLSDEVVAYALPQVQTTTQARPFPVNIHIQASQKQGELKPIWRFFGADEPNFAYMRDGKKLIAELGSLAPGSVYFRTHNLLTTGDGTPALKWGSTNAYTEDAEGRPVYDWTILDRIFDTYLKHGVKPYVQVGFMPKALSIKPEPYQHRWTPTARYEEIYTGWAYPPKDYAKWAELVYQWTRHCVARYGRSEVESWYWEVWNEANIGYWRGTPEEFRKLHDHAIEAIKRALPTARVGGPDTAGSGGQFTRDFIQHTLRGTNYATGKTGTPLDFVAFHAKGAPQFVDGHVRMGIANQLSTIDAGFRLVASYPETKDKPIVIGESDPDGCAACQGAQLGYRNSTMYSSYTAASFARIHDLAARHGVNVEGALTWAFEFEDQPFFAGFRVLATNGIDLPVLNVFRMFSKMKGQRIAVQSDGAVPLDSILKNGVREQPDVSALASLDRNRLSVLMWHYHDDDIAGPDAAINLVIDDLPLMSGKVRLAQYRIDAERSNAFNAWKRMGSPAKPSVQQVAQLQKAGQLENFGKRQSLPINRGSTSLQLTLPRQAVSLLIIEW